MRKLQPIPMDRVKLTGGLLAERQKINAEVTAPLIYEKCRDTGRIEALNCRWDGTEEHRPHPFWDSDIGKMAEAVSYALAFQPNPELEEKLDRVIDLLAQAQEEDGYLNTYYESCEPKEKRFTNLYYMHELYCAGHLMEGASAYFQVTGKRKFLDIMCRYADLLCQKFGTEDGKCHGYCGHPEIELALVRLFEATGEQRYLDLSAYFINQRGKQPYYFEEESLRRGVDTTKTANQKRHLKYYLASRGPYAEYQAHKPVREQTEPVGHAVRAMYLYSGMADIADRLEDKDLYEACRRLWDAMSGTQYAITGGIGPSSEGERFTFAFDLPNEYTYNESCASVALMMWAKRMLQFEADGKYADLMEQTLYNTVLSSLSQDGKRFFYANYLSVHPDRFEHASKAVIDKMRAERQEWFDVSCCPPNISRLIGSLGEYLSSEDKNGVYLHLYTGAKIVWEAPSGPVELKITTDYPWDGNVSIDVACGEEACFDLSLRIPAWCGNWSVQVNGSEEKPELLHGYATLGRKWKNGDKVQLALELKAVTVEANPKVREDCGKLAIMRGPVVYCLEQADNGVNIHDIAIPVSPHFQELSSGYAAEHGAVGLELEGCRYRKEWQGNQLYRKAAETISPAVVRAIPYYLWGNRGFGEMTVWISRK